MCNAGNPVANAPENNSTALDPVDMCMIGKPTGPSFTAYKKVALSRARVNLEVGLQVCCLVPIVVVGDTLITVRKRATHNDNLSC
mgnify:CR=1 FL=1